MGIHGQRMAMVVVLGLALGAAPGSIHAGAIFVSGHDPDFHAQNGNTIGAEHIIQRSLAFARNGNTAPFLFIQTDLSNLGLGDHLNSAVGLNNSGFTAGSTPGNHYVTVTASQFTALSLAQLEQYSAIFVPSDHGGTLTEPDIVALDGRASDIISYLNAGGGLVAFAEDGFHTGGNAAPLFGFLPFLVSSTAFSEAENGNTLTPFGSSLGLATSDINGNFSHNIFTATGGMNIVDRDANGDILSLGFQGQISITGVAPEPSTLISGGLACLLLGVGRAWRRRKAKAIA
jgi:hypothetical protein